MTAWAGLATLGFRCLGGLAWDKAALNALYLEVLPGPYNQGYAFWGQSIVFGILLALLMREMMENYAERCRLMAKMVKNHTIIIGYSHLGTRLVAHCRRAGEPFVLIEKNQELVDDLLREGEPVVIDDARELDALPAANMREARRLIITSNNLETSLIVIKRARDANPGLLIAARCPQDELVEVFERLGADCIYSTSRAAYETLEGFLGKTAAA